MKYLVYHDSWQQGPGSGDEVLLMTPPPNSHLWEGDDPQLPMTDLNGNPHEQTFDTPWGSITGIAVESYGQVIHQYPSYGPYRDNWWWFKVRLTKSPERN